MVFTMDSSDLTMRVTATPPDLHQAGLVLMFGTFMKTVEGEIMINPLDFRSVYLQTNRVLVFGPMFDLDCLAIQI